MDLPYPKIDVTAPITPNEGLGGLLLRTRIVDVQDRFLVLGTTKSGTFKLSAPFDARYVLGKGEVTVAVDIRNGKIFMLSAGDGYKGSLWGKIFVGMVVKDAMEIEPKLYYDEAEGMILCKGRPGISIDVSKTDPPPEIVPEMIITYINVYAEETRTLQGQDGNW